QHVAVLVLTRVAVNRRRERARGHGMLDEREPFARLGSVDQEADADAPEEPFTPLVGADQPYACGCSFHRDSFRRTVVSDEHTTHRGVCQYDWTHMSDQKRPYHMKRRAELEEQTRQRVTESAVALHQEPGPAQ